MSGLISFDGTGSKSEIIDENIPTGGHITEYVDTNRYRSHTFLMSGTFYTPVALTVDVLLVGGGGGGGALGGGGGAGEFRTVTGNSLPAGAYGITCGQGGITSTSYGYMGLVGGITIFRDHQAYGGGGGGSYNGGDGGYGQTDGRFTSSPNPINTRGSGGGGGCSTSGSDSSNATSGGGAGTGGNAGGAGNGGSSPWQGGGGGGAGAAGSNGAGSGGTGSGGVGLVNRYRDGTDIYYAGGGKGVGGSANGLGHEYGGGGLGHGNDSGRSGCVVIRYQIG